MFQGIFKSVINDANKNYIFGTGSIPIQIKTAQLVTFADGITKQQGYQVAEVNKLISTMLTGWDKDGNKPKSMSDNYLELILSCDNGFVVKKRLQFPHIIAWKDDSTQYNIADVYKEFSIDNWLKADDFENPDITLVVELTDEILTTSTATPPEVTTEQSGRFYLYYRNLPVGINRIHIDFHIKTRTEPIDFDLEVIDGMSWKDAQIILASNEQAKINVLLSGVKDVYNFTGAEGNFEEITMHEWSALYQQIISLNPNNKFTHDLYFYLYDESGINTKITELELKNRAFSNSIQDLDGDSLYITDKDGNVIAKIDSDGIESIEVKAGGKRLSEHISDIKQDLYQSKLYITDKNGYVIVKIDETGISCIRIDANNLLQNQWNKKNIATYGDSVTALNGGNYSYPYSEDATKAKWGGKVAKYFNFANIYNRGIGSTTFNYYNTHGGQVAWCRTNTGEYVDRNDTYSYDNYEGQVTIPSDCTPIRGCGSSWLRITTMFPENIKDTIDVVLVMFHNDSHQDMDTECEWVKGSNYDTEWAASEYYENYGGDYNIETVRGGIASTYMKLQAWMPQALIVLMSPISGVYINGNDDVMDLENTESAKMKKLAETVKDIAFRLSVPFIDVYGTDCINSLNKKLRNYITDGIHPYSNAGCKVIARAIISSLQSIVPFLNN